MCRARGLFNRKVDVCLILQKACLALCSWWSHSECSDTQTVTVNTVRVSLLAWRPYKGKVLLLQLEWSFRKKIKHLSRRRLKRVVSSAMVMMIHGLVPVWTKQEAKVNHLLQKPHHLLHRHQYQTASQLCQPLTCLCYMVSVSPDTGWCHCCDYSQSGFSASTWA